MTKRKRVVELEDLPEECLAHIISKTSPVDACRLALVSPTFRSAADSDAVWDEFISLSGYKSTVSQSDDDISLSSRSFTSKKDQFFGLCHHPVLIEHAKKKLGVQYCANCKIWQSFWLDKWSGKKCYMIAAREVVTRRAVHQSWIWTNLPESRFKEAAELFLTHSLQIQWKIDTAMLSVATNYAAYLVLKWRSNDAHGLRGMLAQISVGVSRSTLWTSVVCLESDLNQEGPDFGIRRCPAFDNLRDLLDLRHPWKRKDGWMEIELGGYFNDKGDDGEIKMGTVEVSSAKGLIVQGIEFRPK